MVIGTGLVVGGALLAGSLFGGLFDGIGAETHAPYEHYAPQFTTAPVISTQHPSYQLQFDSPGAIQSTKKEMTTRAEISPSQAYDMGSSEGIPIVPIAIIAVIGLVVMSYVKK